MVPIHDRVVPARPHLVATAGVRHRAHDVARVGRPHHVEVRLLRVPQTEAVVVLRGDHEIAHAGVGRERGHPVGIELDRIEAAEELPVFVDGDLRVVANPLAVIRAPAPLAGEQRVEPPVHEHAEARLAPPGQALIACRALRERRPRTQHRAWPGARGERQRAGGLQELSTADGAGRTLHAAQCMPPLPVAFAYFRYFSSQARTSR